MTEAEIKSKINSPQAYAMYGNSTLKAAWNYQQERIKELEDRLIESRIRIDDLERWVAGIADDHRQIPDWIQQSARSLLAQESG